MKGSASTARGEGKRAPSKLDKLPIEKKYLALLNALVHSSKEQRAALLRTADKKLIKYICECALNVLRGVVSLKEGEKNKLKKHKTVLRKLASKNKDKNSWKNKKRVIVQRGGSFLPFLLQPIIEIVKHML